jgi:site-specific DNA-methyltransferase (adenine-specific)
MLAENRMEKEESVFNLSKNSKIILANCLDWMDSQETNLVSSIVTDPPYGVKEFEFNELDKLRDGNKGGVWRIPPSFDGSKRSPLPRFTALNEKERNEVKSFFKKWAKSSLRILRPGGHVFIASNAFIAPLTWQALIEEGYEFRGEIIRLVRTLRGGDKPKGAEEEYSEVCSMPRGCYEPWGLFRKPLEPKMRVQDCLKMYKTGGLRRMPNGSPCIDVIKSERTPKRERLIANHPSIKPQSLLRLLCYMSLPLGEGIILDTFSGSGSTIAAAESLGLECIGIERFEPYFEMSKEAAKKLAALDVKWSDDVESEEEEIDQLNLI